MCPVLWLTMPIREKQRCVLMIECLFDSACGFCGSWTGCVLGQLLKHLLNWKGPFINRFPPNSEKINIHIFQLFVALMKRTDTIGNPELLPGRILFHWLHVKNRICKGNKWLSVAQKGGREREGMLALASPDSRVPTRLLWASGAQLACCSQVSRKVFPNWKALQRSRVGRKRDGYFLV